MCKANRTPCIGIVFASAILGTAALARAQTGPSPYQQLRALEAQFPRVAYENLLVGTFNAATGAFSGEVSTVTPATKDCSPDIRGKTICKTEKGSSTPPTVVARARSVGLIFKVVNPGSSFVATANGVSVTAPANATSVTVPVTGRPVPGDTTKAQWKVDWRVSSGAKSYRDSLVIDRMSFGLGAFTIPVLPVAIVYDPPQDTQRDNTESYGTSETHGSTVTLALTSQNSLGGEASTQFQPFVDFYSGLKAAGKAASMVPQLAAVATVLKTASEVLPQIFGTASATQLGAGTQVSGSTHQLSVTTKQTYKTARLGPGKGDVFVFFKNFRVGWLSRCCTPLSLLPLGADLIVSSTIAELQEDLATIRASNGAIKTGAHSHVDTLSIQALLALDPFVKGGNYATLAPERFDSLAPPIGLSSVPTTQSFDVSETSIQRLGTTRLSQRIEKDEAGLLAPLELGFGPDASGTITTSVTQSNSLEQSVQQTRHVDVILGGPGLDTSIVNGFYDRVFGTIAVRIITPGPDVVAGDVAADASASTPSSQTAQSAPNAIRPIASAPPRGVQQVGGSSGVSRIAAGAPMSGIAGRSVTLTVGDHTYRSTTDAKGHYVFHIQHSPSPVEATIGLVGGQAPQKFMISPPRIAGLPLAGPMLRVP